jgi:(2R)-ethylmalonyl-CoA mutase
MTARWHLGPITGFCLATARSGSRACGDNLNRMLNATMTRDAFRLHDKQGEPTRDQPWIFRTYAGHTNVRASNRLYRDNLSRGQTGLSIAFDLPTQCGYSSDHPLAGPEIGKVGVPVNSLDDFEMLFAEIPVEQINVDDDQRQPMWLLSLTWRSPSGAASTSCSRGRRRTTSSRNTWRVVPASIRRGTRCASSRTCTSCLHAIRAGTSNICSYHLREAGRRAQGSRSRRERDAVLDAIKARGGVARRFEQCVGRVSFAERRHPVRRRDVQDARVRPHVGRDPKDRYGVRPPSTASSATACR